MKTYIGLHKAKRLCEQNKVEFLYLCKFGSHLYGTNMENKKLVKLTILNAYGRKNEYISVKKDG